MNKNLRVEAEKALSGLDHNGIIEKILSNELSLKSVRDSAIKQDYYYLLQTNDKNISQIYQALSIKYGIGNRFLRIIITGR